MTPARPETLWPNILTPLPEPARVVYAEVFDDGSRASGVLPVVGIGPGGPTGDQGKFPELWVFDSKRLAIVSLSELQLVCGFEVLFSPTELEVAAALKRQEALWWSDDRPRLADTNGDPD